MQLALLIVAALAVSAPQNWPAFLGSGHSDVDARTLPLEWSPEKNIAWKQDLPGYGQSSPVIWGDTVYLTTVEGPMKERNHILALSLATGEILWDHTFPSSTEGVKNSVYVSRAAPTPVVDADGIYCFFESGDVRALSHSGQLRWEQSLIQDTGPFKNRFSLGSSPAQTDDAMIILIDDPGPSYLISLKKSDGSTNWKTDRMSRTSWSSPVLVDVDGSQQIVISSDGSVDGYEPTTGEQLWSNDEVGGNTATSPFAFASGKFLMGASTGEDGKNTERAKKSNMAVSIVREGDQFVPKVLWRNEETTSSFGSPMVHNGYAYWINRTGVVYCFDAETGEQKYAHRTKQSAWATPLGFGDRVYFFGKDGLTTVMKSGPEPEVLAENQLWDPDEAGPDEKLVEQEQDPMLRRGAANFAKPTLYGAAVVNNHIVLRIGNRAYCIR